MSNENIKKIVEDIYNSRFDSLKEDVAKAVSNKAVSILESKKAEIGKAYFTKK